MINQIRANIFLSGQDEIQNLSYMKEFGITAVLNVGDNSLDPYYRGTEILMCKIGLEDNDLNDPKNKDLAVLILKELLDRGHTVLVHCVAGASRSPYIVARYISELEDREIRDVLAEMKIKREEVFLSPALL